MALSGKQDPAFANLDDLALYVSTFLSLQRVQNNARGSI